MYTILSENTMIHKVTVRYTTRLIWSCSTIKNMLAWTEIERMDLCFATETPIIYPFGLKMYKEVKESSITVRFYGHAENLCAAEIVRSSFTFRIWND